MKKATGNPPGPIHHVALGRSAIVVPLIALPLLLAAGALIPSRLLFGIDQWAVLPIWLWVSGLILYGIILILSFRSTALGVALQAKACNLKTVGKILIWIFGSLALAAIFVIFRSESFFYGDGYMVLASAGEKIFSPVNGDEAVKVLTVLAFRVAHASLGRWCPDGSELPIAILNSVAGVALILGLIKLSGRLSKDTQVRIFLVLSSLTSACTVLCFGWMEHYTLPLAALIWSCYFSICYLHDRMSIWRPVVAWCVTGGFALELFPLLVVFLLIDQLQKRNRLLSAAKLNAGLVVASLIGATVFFFLMPNVAITPLISTTTNPYWSFSLDHLADMVNITLLVAPLGILFLIASAIGRRVKAGSVAETFLATQACALFLICFWIEPILGAPRDWDLLSFFGLPLTLYSARNIAVHVDRKLIRACPIPLAILIIMLIAPSVYEKHNPQLAVERLDALLWTDLHYQSGYDSGKRCITWGAILHNQMLRPDLGEKYLNRRIELVPNDDITWFNLGIIQYNRKSYDSATESFEKAYNAWPDHTLYLVNYVMALQAIHSDKVRDLLPKVAAIRSDTVKILRMASLVLIDAGMTQEAIPVLHKAVRLLPNDYELNTNLAVVFYNLQQLDSSVTYFRRALVQAPLEGQPQIYMGIIGGLATMGKTDEARAEAAEFFRRFPHDSSAIAVQQYLNPGN